MAGRRSGPWLRSSDNCFYTTIGRRLVKLGSAGDPWGQIQKAFHSEHAKSEKPSALTVAWLVDEYLEFVQKHRAQTTYAWYREYLCGFIARVGEKLRAENLTPKMVSDWIQRNYGKASPSSQHAAARCVVRVMSWAIKEWLLDRSPLVGFVKPAPSHREVAITSTQYAECLKHAKGRFGDAVKFLWQTGCRPQELRIIEARWIDYRKVGTRSAVHCDYLHAPAIPSIWQRGASLIDRFRPCSRDAVPGKIRPLAITSLRATNQNEPC